MRTFLTAAALACSLSTPAVAATRNFGIESFEKVRIEGPFKVRLATGVAPFASATGSAAAIDRVAIDVRGNTLVIHNNSSSWGDDPGQNVGPVEINLGTHDLNSAWIIGSGSLAIDHIKGLTFDLSVQGSAAAAVAAAQVDQLNVAMAGTGSATVAGHAGKLTAVVRGVGSLDAANLIAKDASIGVEGTASISANASDSVVIDGSGASTIRLTGGPACTLHVNGSASISGCRSTR